jgi:hypothetical protein
MSSKENFGLKFRVNQERINKCHLSGKGRFVPTGGGKFISTTGIATIRNNNSNFSIDCSNEDQIGQFESKRNTSLFINSSQTETRQRTSIV